MDGEFVLDTPVVRSFVAEVEAAVAAAPSPHDACEAIRPRFAELLADPEWLPAEYQAPAPESGMGGGIGQWLLYRADDGSLSLFALVVPPAAQTPIHDHLAWGLVGLYRGEQDEEIYVERDDGLELVERRSLSPGDFYALIPPRDDIHRVRTTSPETSVSIHLLTNDTGCVWRHAYDESSGFATPFRSGYANVACGDDGGALLRAYDEQLRAHVHDRIPETVSVDRDGPLLRTVGFGNQGWVEYRDLGGLDGEELDALIARQVEFFAQRAEPFEWKLHGHDLPADLSDRLRAAGFVPEDQETVVIARADAVAAEPHLPEGVAIREARGPEDLARIAQLQESVWGEGHGWLVALADEQAADPDGLRIFVAEAGDLVVSAGWVRFPSRTEFATFWGGATLPDWRGRGIYRALVAHRARLAVDRGRRYIEVDASDDSRPILERLGFVPVTTTTPYVWSPSVTVLQKGRAAADE